MSLSVDPAAGAVVGEGHWPFRFDCRTGQASIEIGGRVVRVRPLLWREKIILSRFAHVGGEFLAEHFLQICLDDSAPGRPEGREREVLTALALWVNYPEGAGKGLAFDGRLLARATVGVCRLMGLTPGDLDARDATEVESFWSLARDGGETHGEADEESLKEAASDERLGAAAPRGVAEEPQGADGLTRIVILPDPPAAPERTRTGAHAAGIDSGGLRESPGVAGPEVQNLSAREAEDESPRGAEPSEVEEGPTFATPSRAGSEGSARVGGAERPTPGTRVSAASTQEGGGAAARSDVGGAARNARPTRHERGEGRFRVTPSAVSFKGGRFEFVETEGGSASPSAVVREEARPPEALGPAAETVFEEEGAAGVERSAPRDGVEARSFGSDGRPTPASSPLPSSGAPARPDGRDVRPVFRAESRLSLTQFETRAPGVAPEHGAAETPRASVSLQAAHPAPAAEKAQAPAAFERGELFEELAEELERAASELGID